MNVDEIKHRLASLSPSERNEISAFLFHLRQSSDAEYLERIETRLSDADVSHWLTPDEFQKRLDGE